MADVEVHCVGRLSASGLTNNPVEVLLFVTPDHSRMLPLWVERPADLGGRPSDSDVLATILSSDDGADPWTAQITTNSRGQMTAGLLQGNRFIDVRPSVLDVLWHAGVLFDVSVCEAVAPAMVPVNPLFTEELIRAVEARRVAEAKLSHGDDELDDDYLAELAERLVLRWGGVGLRESPDPSDDFADMWKAMGLSEEMGDWLGEEDFPEGDK